MKSERRHELKTNSLAHGIEQLPEVGRQHGSKIMLAVVAVLLVIVLVRFYLTNKTEKADEIASALTQGRSVLSGVRGDHQLVQMSSRRIAERRDSMRKGVEEAVTIVLSNSTDPAQIAEAKLLKGDLYWQLSTMADLPGATSQPDLKLDKSVSGLLDVAAEQYNEVMGAKDKVPAPLVASARFGLAAIAETRGNLDGAKEQYDAVVADKSVGDTIHEMATARLEDLTRLRKPMPLGQPRKLEVPLAAPATSPTSGPTTSATTLSPTQPTTGPATGPTTAPVVELLLPTTSPATAATTATVPAGR